MRKSRSWRDLIAISELEKGDVTPVQFGARELAVYDTVDGIFVSMARCTHGAANLCDGYLTGGTSSVPCTRASSMHARVMHWPFRQREIC